MNNKWHCYGNNYYMRESSQELDTLSKGVYTLKLDPKTFELYLSKVSESFKFNYKLYGVQDQLVDRLVKSYHNLPQNLGALFTGLKGTGKSVTSKLLCNKLELPVVLITEVYPGIAPFISNIQQDVVVFVDEYEKIFAEQDHELLTVMDGALDSDYRRFFLLTSNTTSVSRYLIQRPGRIRYVKNFTDLDKETISMIVNDLLEDKSKAETVVGFISKLEIITIDIVKAIVSEVNIHGDNPEDFEGIFNVCKVKPRYNIYSIGKKGKEILSAYTTLSPEQFKPRIIDWDIGNGVRFHEKLNDNEWLVFETDNENGGWKEEAVRLLFEKVPTFHKNYE